VSNLPDAVPVVSAELEAIESYLGDRLDAIFRE
jgi:hypothetical protein